MSENKTIYKTLRDAIKVTTNMSQMQNMATILIHVQETPNQPKDLQTRLSLSVDGDDKTAIIYTDERRAILPLSQLWETLDNLSKRQTAKSGTAKAVAITKQEMDNATERYCEQVIENMTAKLETLGGEWDLPSNFQSDEILVGDPRIVLLPQTLYLDHNKRLHIVCIDEDNVTYTELVSYHTLSVNDIQKLNYLLDKPIEE